MTDWKLIAEIPDELKDGRTVLLYGRIEWENYGDENDGPEMVTAAWCDVDEWDLGNRANWQVINANPYVDSCHPTHYAELSAPS